MFVGSIERGVDAVPTNGNNKHYHLPVYARNSSSKPIA
jgi:hypothetical protein